MTRRKEIGAIVELQPPDRRAGLRGIIIDIGRDCGGPQYLIQFSKPVTRPGKNTSSSALFTAAI